MSGPTRYRRVLRHWPFLLLLLLLSLHSLRTFGNFLLDDDLKWIHRTVADAPRPWNAFVEPLFGDYYRPIPHLMWLLNYYVWGFNFDGHQFMFALLWLSGVWLVYAVGCRLGGRLAGFIAAAIVGLNDIYLTMVSWKSWYTSLAEFAAVLAWVWAYMKWMELRQRRYLIASILLGGIAVLSRELAPLIISATVLVTAVIPALARQESPGRKKAVLGLLIWAVVSAGLLAALPSYRSGMKAVLFPVKKAPVSAAQVAGEGPSAGYFAHHYRSHTAAVFSRGVFPCLLLFAALAAGLRSFQSRHGWSGRYRYALIGAFLVGAIVLGAPLVAKVMGDKAQAFSDTWIQPVTSVLLLGLFFIAALVGDRWDRMLGAWFLVSFVPILVLKHSSNAYHLLAFTALALYIGKALVPVVQDELLPSVARLQRKAPANPNDAARYVLSAVLILALAVQACMLYGNFRMSGGEKSVVHWRVMVGRAMEDQVKRTVGAFVANSPPIGQIVSVSASRAVHERLDARMFGGRAFVSAEPYAELAGLILKTEHGFKVEPLERPGVTVIGLRAFDAPLRVYTDAIPFDETLFRRFNAFPDPSFENPHADLPVVNFGRTGNHSIGAVAEGPKPRVCNIDLGPFGLRAGTGYVFGGFVRMEADGIVRMSLMSTDQAGYAKATPPISGRNPDWALLWECAAPPAEKGRFVFRVIEGVQLKGGRVLVDDVFFCPVEPLIAAARGKK